MTAFCVKCQGPRELVQPVPIVTKNGRNAIQSKCPDCGTKLTRMGKLP